MFMQKHLVLLQLHGSSEPKLETTKRLKSKEELKNLSKNYKKQYDCNITYLNDGNQEKVGSLEELSNLLFK